MKKLSFILLILPAFFCIAQPGLGKNDNMKNLPPGLEKKVARGESLPPGWQKKISRGEVIEPSIYRQGRILVPANSRGEEIIMIQERILRIMKDNRKIIDILN